MDPGIVAPTLVLAVAFGLLGSKLSTLIENWAQYSTSPLEVFTPWGGMSYLGGFLLAAAAIYLYLRAQSVPFLRFCDAAAPSLMIGYGIARMGCQLSGDGDYGAPTGLPWGMSYPNGTVPTLEKVHPAPVYETLVSFALFALLWRLRQRARRDGWLFSLYLVVSGTERFLVEFIRLNPRWVLGMTQAQMISLVLIASGITALVAFRTTSGVRGG